MKTLTFNCTFLSDVILNASSATAGTTDVLDYIPGAKFLGIVAKKHYKNYEANVESILNLFYNGNVRFGDAHLLCEGKRSLKIPFDFFEDKNKDKDKPTQIWVHRIINKVEGVQLKQKRSGYFLPIENKVVSAKSDYSLKSAYDADKRRSKDKQMYGYQAIKKGTVWQFSVEIDDAAKDFEAQIKTALIGERSLGKSRSAQYGRVKICLVNENPKNEFKSSGSGKTFVLYAESNLCFVDEQHGQFTVTPTAAQIGFSEKAQIDWSKSQVRHRIYAPWNGTRSARDADRWIIEKGSVFIVVSEVEESINLEKGVGLFRSEGYGKILVNPNFLMEGTLALDRAAPSKGVIQVPNSLKDDKVLALLGFRKEMLSPENAISKAVANFIKELKGVFDNITNSQWGQVRNIAQNSSDEKMMNLLLFNPAVGFLYTAKRKEEWGKVADLLEKGLNNIIVDKRKFLIALSSEMAKKEKTDGK